MIFVHVAADALLGCGIEGIGARNPIRREPTRCCESTIPMEAFGDEPKEVEVQFLEIHA